MSLHPHGSKNKTPPMWQSYLQRSIALPSLSLTAWPASGETTPTRPIASRTPIEWAEQQATIVHPSLGRMPFAPYAYQRDFLDGYAAPRRIIVKARQIGFSQVFALEALYAAIHEPETTILLVSRSQDLAVNLLRYCYLTH